MKNKRISFSDSTAAEIDSVGRWDLTFPNGTHKRGHAATVENAEKQIKRARDEWILAEWERGSQMKAGHRLVWAVPLR